MLLTSRSGPTRSGTHVSSSRCHATGTGLYTLPVPANDAKKLSRLRTIGLPHLAHTAGNQGVTSELAPAMLHPGLRGL